MNANTENFLLLCLDKFFFIFHAAFTLFCMLGWIWRKTRKLNLIFLGLTGFSWLGLGLFYGIGYCPFTDWHWQVRITRGFHDFPRSYIKFLLDEVTGLDWNTKLVDIGVICCYITAFSGSTILNLLDYHKKKSKKVQNLL